MSLILQIVQEEAQRILLMCEQYEMELNRLPKGTIVIKKIGNHEYYYLKYRKVKKVVTDYLGRDCEKIDKVRQQLKKRKHFEIMLAELKKEAELIQKVLEVYP